MNNTKDFDPEHFGPFLPFLKNTNITDICWNGQDLWIDDILKGRYKVPRDILPPDMPGFVDQLSARIANISGESFNQYETLLETMIGLYRISVVHEYAAHTGTSIAIRRTSDQCRLTKAWCLEHGYCSEEIWNFFPKIIKAGFSVIAGGLPGVGKTELLKMLSQYIPPYERAIVIEDSPEFHYRAINPQSDCTEWRISSHFDYETALKASLRQRPDWNILAEARGRETLYLMENFSSGLKVLTSTHLDDQVNLIPRLENMIGETLASARIKNEIYLRGLCVCVIKRHMKEDGTHVTRKLEQISFLSREDKTGPTTTVVVDGGKIINRELPPNVLKKFVAAGIKNPLGGNTR